MDKDNVRTAHVERTHSSNGAGDDVMPVHSEHNDQVTGTVKLIVGNETVLLPTPSPDPKDPLNLHAWRKWALLVLVSLFSCSSVVLASGLGSIFTAVEASYPGQEKKATDLMTYPTLFMGIGNLISMPLSGVIGRRPLFLFSVLILTLASIWCAKSGSLGSHIAGRDIMSLAAGQSEALAPMMVQEVHFLHERARKLSWFVFMQNVAISALFFSSPYMVSAWSWRWWYGFFAIFNGFIFVLAVLFVSETAYNRPDDAPTGEVHVHMTKKNDVEDSAPFDVIVRATTKHGIVLDPAKYGERTWGHDLKLWSKQGPWSEVPYFFLDFVKGLCHPLLLWLLLLNGAFMGIYVFQATTFSTILMSPPYSFGFNSLGYVQGAQIFDVMVMLPLLGYGSDLVIRWMSRRNDGTYKPEYRLITFCFPAIAGIICAIIYGQAGAFPLKWQWSAVAVSYVVIYFGFLGANVMALTYGVDSFPLKAGPVLVVICAGRGFISFGLSYAVLPAVAARGYNGTMDILAAIAAVLAAFTIPMYFLGPYFRKLGSKYYSFGMSRVNHGAHSEF